MSEPALAAPYRVEAVAADGQWHLTVRSLDDHPDRGEVDAVVVTVTPDQRSDGLPARALDDMLGRCGFARDGAWERRREQGDHGDRQGDEGAAERWSAPCRQSNTWSAPSVPATPPGAAHDTSAD
ncbi:hypothetical protein VSR01_03865 [Actinacidiphila sp. DG2A-62]|uniref:hypothetical protein n=1 Tax=Actinacidiphila sp. DG2A-62 TaxID=3108821 RepID=UPI002DB91702|nr:hypothetical protein [Actinacidiphila sp. DG2A-62]MEC3992731.1 hypothetical protein [Actinacidiphila sp. DG2A-62]